MNSNTEKEPENAHFLQGSVMPRLFYWRFVYKDKEKAKGYTIRKAETKEQAIADFIRIFPDLTYYRIDFLNEA